MLSRNHLVEAAFAALLAATPLAAQTDRSVVVGVYGGGYSHLLNLNDAGPSHGTAHFTRGPAVGATVGVQLTRYVAVHGDFTYSESQARGDETFADGLFDRFFYGGHVEFGYPVGGGVTPYLFLGGGAVTIDELGSAATVGTFTKPAGMFGAGFFYAIAKTGFDLFAEGKGLVYQWDRGGFVPMQWYITTTEGQAYPMTLSTGDFDHTQWDFTYTLGLSYRFGTRRATPAATPAHE